MSVLNEPEKAVPVLLERLSKAKNRLQLGADPGLGSKFDEIEELLKQIDSLPKIKKWETKLVEQLCLLEQFLDDDDNFPADDPSSHPELHQKLHLFQQDIDKLKDVNRLISQLNQELILKLGGQSSRPRIPPQDGDPRTAVSKEWADLGVEHKILGTDAMSTLCKTFPCLADFQLKMCSLCLSVFPENAAVKKRPLIYWWMGEGLVAKTPDATAEEVGERVFQELLQEGFIKLITNSSFFVYPWIRRMLIHLATESGFLKFTGKDTPHTPHDSQRRSFLFKGIPKGEGVEDVLTVNNINEQYIGDRSAWLRRLHKVEVLQMGRWQKSAKHHIEADDYKELLFNGLGSQKHLKYLSLRGISRIESLPPSISKLVSLQILDLRACHNLEELPNSIAELKNLTHLDVSECYLLENMPRGLVRLSNLQVMKGFVVGGNACKLADMARLRRLRKLGLRVLNQGNAQLQSLGQFETLQILTISWGVTSSDTEVVVKLPPKLTKLDLRCVPFVEMPDWMKANNVPNLKKLYITGVKLNSINKTGEKLNSITNKYPANVSVRLKHLQKKSASSTSTISSSNQHT